MPATRILVVTDDAHLVNELSNAFSSEYAVHIAEDAVDAELRLSHFTPALAIVDMRTGNAGGFGLVRDMRQDGRLAKVPVLMLVERPQDGWLARTAGADVVRIKPVGVEQLLDEARSLIRSQASVA
jgi:DNA-binding response OmpR family regulator